jgi:hypothetical protein
MRKKFDRVYQFKISLKKIKPPIWRRIQVPETYTFWGLHVAIQDVMGWKDTHLHHFEIVNPSTGMKEEIGIPDEDFEMEHIIFHGWKRKITSYFTTENNNADYIYDYGDDWEHTITMERILPRERGIIYPICIAGERSCPPEDCGGTSGYEDFLEIIMDPNHKEYEETLTWVEGTFDPEHFDITEVVFDNPNKRLEYVLE